jgi:4-diphosphocytidyl-2-C-methyl-D-erythritol kinase
MADQLAMSKRAESELWWPAPAKINLFLHVVGKRADGYHDLQTVFQLLDYGDELCFEINQSARLTRQYDFGFSEDADLCIKAAALLKQYADKPQLGASIKLNKRLPMGGGLGGGSSNAATTLLALNHLWGLDLSKQELADIGLKLGADVPVFVHGNSAWAEGVGERLTPVSLASNWYIVLNPNVCVSTAKVFAHKHLTATTQMMKIRTFLEGHGENQLETIVKDEYPEVARLLSWLDEQVAQINQPVDGWSKARMSGSGASVFSPVASQQIGQEILARCPQGVSGFVARGINRHPILAML